MRSGALPLMPPMVRFMRSDAITALPAARGLRSFTF